MDVSLLRAHVQPFTADRKMQTCYSATRRARRREKINTKCCLLETRVRWKNKKDPSRRDKHSATSGIHLKQLHYNHSPLAMASISSSAAHGFCSSCIAFHSSSLARGTHSTCMALQGFCSISESFVIKKHSFAGLPVTRRSTSREKLLFPRALHFPPQHHNA